MINSMVKTWDDITDYMKVRFDRDADLNAVLFVIGLREFGKKKTKFTKEEKQDLMNLAFCKILSFEGYFEVAHLDSDGWPVWKQSKPVPKMSVKEQEEFIKAHIVHYFESEELL